MVLKCFLLISIGENQQRKYMFVIMACSYEYYSLGLPFFSYIVKDMNFCGDFNNFSKIIIRPQRVCKDKGRSISCVMFVLIFLLVDAYYTQNKWVEGKIPLWKLSWKCIL